jgi:hypothetical protein
MIALRILIIATLSLLVVHLPANPEPPLSLDLGVSASAGYTALDFEAASGYPDDQMEDWDQFHYKITAYGLYPLAPPLSAGLELGYNYLYYYYYKVPYGPSPVYREATWYTIFCLGLVRLDLGELLFIQGGAGVHFFIDDGTAFALSAAAGIRPRVGDFRIPVYFRIDPIFGAGTPTTIALGAGAEYELKGTR